MRKKISFALVIIGTMLGFILLSGCTTQNYSNNTNNNKTIIATTFYPIYYVTKNIVGNTSTVIQIIPQNTPIDNYRLTPNDLIQAQNAKIYIKEGIGFNELENKITNALPTNIKIITATTGIQILSLGNGNENGNPVSESYLNQTNKNYGNDPHVWISPQNLIIIAKNIEKNLSEIYPNNKQIYQNNTNHLIQSLNQLNTQFKQNLSNCSKNVVLVNHDAFSYLGKEYGFKTVYISQLDPESAPTPEELILLEKNAKQYNLSYLFYSEFADPTNAKKLAHDINATTLPLYLLLGVKDNLTLPEQLKKNLYNLKLALDCK